VILSTIPLLIFIVCLFLAKENLLFLGLAALFGGMESALFWFGYHGLFIKSVNEHSFGFSEGICRAVGILTLTITPILGSVLVLTWGFWSLFIVAAFFSLISALVISFSPEVKPYRDVSMLRVLGLFKKNLRPFGAYLGHGGEFAVYGSIWPIF